MDDNRNSEQQNRNSSDYELWKEKHGMSGRASSADSSRRSSGVWRTVAIVAVILIAIAGAFFLGKALNKKGGAGGLTPYIAILDVKGEIAESSSSSSLLSASDGYDQQFLTDTIDSLIKDDANKGIFLSVNTPGGSASASDELYLKLKEYSDKTGKPIYAYFGSMAASGGYYVSASADRIYANRNCWTGSIGVTMGTMLDISGLLEKYGIKTETITSGANKAMGSQFEPMTDEQREIFQGLIDDAYDRFVEIVADGRKMDEKKVRKIADGRIYTAAQAKENGLIDDIMGEEEAKEAMQKEQKLEKVSFKHLEPDKKEMSIFDIMTQASSDSKLGELEILLRAAGSGNIFTISYKANISK